MPKSYTSENLAHENRINAGTRGVSSNCSGAGFVPAFRDFITGEVQLSRFEDGSTAPVHLLEGLPEHWVLERDLRRRVTRVRGSIEAGFLRNGRFFSRDEIARRPLDS